VETAGRNVLGGELEPCSFDPLTGFYRDATCRTGPQDRGMHVVCAEMTEEFLQPGDRWCVCADRWREALEADVAPPVVLEATHVSALEFATLEDFQARSA